MSFICHIDNYTEYNEEWNVFSAFNPSKCTHLEQWAADCGAPGEQSWTSCRSRDSNPQPWVTSGFKSNALSIRPTTALIWCQKRWHGSAHLLKCFIILTLQKQSPLKRKKRMMCSTCALLCSQTLISLRHRRPPANVKCIGCLYSCFKTPVTLKAFP